MAPAFRSKIFSINGDSEIHNGILNPSIAGFTAPVGSIYIQDLPNDANIWLKKGTADTGWFLEENVTNKATNFSVINDILYPTIKATEDRINSKKRNGIVLGTNFSGNPKIYDVVFSTPYSSTNYTISIIGQVSRVWSYTNKTAAGFRINSNANTVITGEVLWDTKEI